VIQEFSEYNTITTNTTSYQTQLPQTIKRFGIGVATHISKRTYLYGEYNYAVGKNFREPLALNIGLRISW
jgi:outer membrane autotransporter protein